ncbi:helix-turn-helix domain-containing protein [Amycolatopsis sp. NPDC004378]
MGKIRPTVDRMQLGRAMRGYRVKAGKTLADVAQLLRCSTTRISSFEDGQANLNVREVETLTTFYVVPGAEAEAIAELAAQARKRSRRNNYANQLPEQFSRFSLLEDEASLIMIYQSGLIPSLVQSPLYMRAIREESQGVTWSADELEMRISFALKRQQELANAADTKRIHIILGEHAVTDVLRNYDVMEQQLRHLLGIAYTQPSITLQILRASTPKSPARSGGFTVFDFDGRMDRVAAASVLAGPLNFIEDPQETAEFDALFTRYQQNALDQAQTIDYLAQLVDDMGK